MIKYQLICEEDHEFEGWFGDSAAFESQQDSGLLTCPSCGSAAVRRAPNSQRALGRGPRPVPRAASGRNISCAGRPPPAPIAKRLRSASVNAVGAASTLAHATAKPPAVLGQPREHRTLFPEPQRAT